MAGALTTGNKKKSSFTAAQVASVRNSRPNILAPKSLPKVERSFYAPRSTPFEHDQVALFTATLLDCPAGVLRDAHSILPVSVTTNVN